MLRTLCITTALACMVALPPAALAQSRNRSDDGCNDGWGGGRQRRHCEVREYTLQGANPIDIDAGRNGGIKVRGWDRPEVHVTAKVQGYARTDADARRVAAGVRVEAAGTTVRAEGPDFGDDDENWSVSFEISAPRNVILTLNTENGGIALEGLRGKVNFRARNGGVSISDMSGGDIKGETTNGGVSVDLNGDHWDGAGLDVTTTNGGVKMNIPDNYSAVLHTGTVNGRVSIDFPVTIQGNITRQLTTTLGSGGAKISAVTTNGGVVIRKR